MLGLGPVHRLARHRKIVEPEVVGESDSEVEGEAWRIEREDSSEEEEEEIDDEVRAGAQQLVASVLPEVLVPPGLPAGWDRGCCWQNWTRPRRLGVTV